MKGWLRCWPRNFLLATSILMLVVACAPTLQQATGVVLSVDSPALGRVDSFELLDSDGKRLLFDASELPYRTEFPAAHLFEHQALGDRIVVTYKRDGDRLVVTQLDDSTPASAES